MIKYNLKLNDFGYPNIIFEKKYEFDDKTKNWTCISEEITNIFGSYLEQIIKELKEVMEGKRDECHFGFETTLIFCYRKGYTFKDIYTNEIVSYPEGKVIITYDYGDEELETDIKPEEIYKMMKEWKEYIEKWEKESGKKFGKGF